MQNSSKQVFSDPPNQRPIPDIEALRFFISNLMARSYHLNLNEYHFKLKQQVHFVW